MPRFRNREKRRKKADQKRAADIQRSTPSPRLRPPSVEVIGAIGATAGALWAAYAEFTLLIARAIGGAAIGAIGAVGALKVWMYTRQKDRGDGSGKD